MGTRELTLQRYAEMRAEMEAGVLRDELLSREGISCDEWIEVQTDWLTKMGKELDRGRFELTNQYTKAFLAHQSSLVGAASAEKAEAVMLLPQVPEAPGVSEPRLELQSESGSKMGPVQGVPSYLLPAMMAPAPLEAIGNPELSAPALGANVTIDLGSAIQGAEALPFVEAAWVVEARGTPVVAHHPHEPPAAGPAYDRDETTKPLDRLEIVREPTLPFSAQPIAYQTPMQVPVVSRANVPILVGSAAAAQPSSTFMGEGTMDLSGLPAVELLPFVKAARGVSPPAGGWVSGGRVPEKGGLPHAGGTKPLDAGGTQPLPQSPQDPSLPFPPGAAAPKTNLHSGATMVLPLVSKAAEPKVPGTGTMKLDPAMVFRANVPMGSAQPPHPAPTPHPAALPHPAPPPESDPGLGGGLPALTVDEYAELTIEFMFDPDHAHETLRRFNLTTSQRALLDAAWQERFSVDAKLSSTFDQACGTYHSRKRKNRR